MEATGSRQEAGVMPTTYPEVPLVGPADRADPATDPSLGEGGWKALVMTEAVPKKKAAWNTWNPNDPRLTPERDAGDPGFAINWYWAFHLRRWWRLRHSSPRS
jgi:hypothetical protein